MRVAASSPIRVLIAEDDAVLRAVLAELIGSEPTLELTDAVGDAGQAIAAATSQHPAVALLDVRLHGGGAVAARGIKRCSPGTRVLALSVDNRRARVLEMLAAGADGYLPKDAPFAAIVMAIKRSAAAPQQQRIRQSPGERVRKRAQQVDRVSPEGTLRVVFEPICTLAGKTVGAEAIARFTRTPRQNPGCLAEARPGALPVQLEITAARAALAQLPSLPEPLHLRIRVSPATLVGDAFRSLLEQSDSARVVVEIADHTRLDDGLGLRRALCALRAHGARVAIDSTGVFANVRNAHRLRPEFMKLDRSLIPGIETPGPRQALATAVIAFCERIDATVIADGIERAPQITTLVDLGVRYGQGPFFA
jgi:EAL domain-containing protein (putative c-di-GMP-specific phosphodiesterase class I)/CheY-like chemotaxis protein